MKCLVNIIMQTNLGEINIMKKVLAISALSLGFLSSAPSALCAPLECYFGFVPAQYLGKKDLGRFSMVCKKFGLIIPELRKNPLNMSSLKDIEVLPGIETFEDHHSIINDNNRNNHVNTFLGEVKTLIYYPESFDIQRFHDILGLNNVENLRNIRPTIDKDKKELLLKGNKWECKIHPFNGVNYRVEYVEKETDKRIIFLFRPSILNGGIVKNFNKLLEGYGLKELININNTLKTFMIPNNVTEISEFAFYECKALEKITIPENVTKINEFAFYGCESLEEIEIPNSVTKISDFAFEGCKTLKEIEIPNSVTKISRCAFSECQSLKEIKIPNSITEIDRSTFRKCKSLKEIEIPNSVKSISSYAFDECESLKEIEIPNSVTEIGKGAFSGCASLEKIEIPNSITEIGKNIFKGCGLLKEITIPNSATRIGAGAFSGCKSLKEIEIPDSVTEIGEDVFDGCTSLEKIKIPNSVTEIGNFAFFRCKSLEEIEIPNSVKSIGNCVFVECTSLHKIRWNNHDYYSIREFFADFNK